MSDSYEVTGTLRVIGGIQTFPSGFTKREIIIETDGKYPQLIKLELFKDQTELTNGLKPEDPVTASFNLRGNEHNGKYYTNLQAWRLSKDQAPGQQAPSQPRQPLSQIVEETSQPKVAVETAEEVDEIPF